MAVGINRATDTVALAALGARTVAITDTHSNCYFSSNINEERIKKQRRLRWKAKDNRCQTSWDSRAIQAKKLEIHR